MNKQMIAAALAAAAVIAAPTHANAVALPSDGSWKEFTVDNSVAPAYGNGWIAYDGSPLSFSFTISAGSVGTLTVVDAGYAGDTFAITNFGTVIGNTSSVASGTVEGPLVFDFDAALANPAYSRGVFTLGAGSYSISGWLLQSVLDDSGAALGATDGGVRLSVSVVPEPTGAALLLGGLAALALVARRRQSNPSI